MDKNLSIPLKSFEELFLEYKEKVDKVEQFINEKGYRKWQINKMDEMFHGITGIVILLIHANGDSADELRRKFRDLKNRLLALDDLAHSKR